MKMTMFPIKRFVFKSIISSDIKTGSQAKPAMLCCNLMSTSGPNRLCMTPNACRRQLTVQYLLIKSTFQLLPKQITCPKPVKTIHPFIPFQKCHNIFQIARRCLSINLDTLTLPLNPGTTKNAWTSKNLL